MTTISGHSFLKRTGYAGPYRRGRIEDGALWDGKVGQPPMKLGH